MPVGGGFLQSLADKAQSAIQSSSLGQHIPGAGSSSTTADANASTNTQGSGNSGLGYRSHALEALQYQIRSLQQQYSSSTSPVQKLITTEKGVALDIDSLSRDAKAQSKELYVWGQTEPADLKDVTDRLAYINFVQGSLAETLAKKLDAARAPLKALRDAQNALTPRRNVRATLQNQIGRIENDQAKGMEKKLNDLREQLQKAEREDEPLEKELELLKRKAVRESETIKWAALREYGEKTLLLSQASETLISVLPSVPPTSSSPYTGAEITANTRAALQHALDNHKPGNVTLPTPSANLNRSDTRSFGETHAEELSNIDSESVASLGTGLPVTPPAQPTGQPSTSPLQVPEGATATNTSNKSAVAAGQRTASPPQKKSPPLNPARLNQAPAPVPPAPASPPESHISPAVPADTVNPKPKVPAITPTVAETGVPISTGSNGPGPSSGSLRELKSPTNGHKGSVDSTSSLPKIQEGGTPAEVTLPGYGANATGGAPKHESAEEEKRRLEREERERILREGGSAQPAYESAEDEKKRLEREERERILRGESGSAAPGSGGPTTREGHPGDDGEELPPYQDFTAA